MVPSSPTHQQRHGKETSPSYALVGADKHDNIELPQSVHAALIKIVAALHAGKAVAVAPQTMKLTTQQAAGLLGASRPTVARLINNRVLPAERIGNRHRLLLDNVLPYRDERGTLQYDSLAATAVEFDANDNPEQIRRKLGEARRATPRRTLRYWLDVFRISGHLGAMAKPAA